jgi:hypothetical protein
MWSLVIRQGGNAGQWPSVGGGGADVGPYRLLGQRSPHNYGRPALPEDDDGST